MFEMNRIFVIVGLIIAILGAGGYVDSSYTHIILTGTHHTIPLLGIGIAVLGALVAVGGVTMGGSPTRTSNEFKCSVCGATFASQGALDQHTKAKHPSQA